MMAPVTSEEEYRRIRRGQALYVAEIRRLDPVRDKERIGWMKRRLTEFNYSCLPNEDGTLRRTQRLSRSVGADIDLDRQAPDYEARMAHVVEVILQKKDVIGLLMLERSVTKGYHCVFRRRAELSQEENLRWMSEQIGVEYDAGAKDHTRVFFSTTDDASDLLFLSQELFDNGEALPSPADPKVMKQDVQASDTGGSEVGAPADAYKGIPYADIISRLLLAMGVDGTPEAGERNNYLYGLVRELRYITDFSMDRVMAVLPDWGLPQEEVRRTVASALASVRKTEIPMRLQNIIGLLKAEVAAVSEETEEAERPEEQMIPRRLPRFFRVLLKAYPEEYKEAVLMASMVPLGGLLTRLRAYYLDGSVHTPSFIGCIRSPQASGKSFARHLFSMLTEPIREQDCVYRQMEREYNEKKRAAKNTKAQPQDPMVKIRLIPATASNAMILKRADYAEGLHLLTFAEEIDTITKGNKAGAWSQKSDLYRMAFDNAEWGQDYMSEASYSGSVKIAYNLLMCGTPKAVERCFADVEDGLVSRIMFITLPDMLGAKMPKFGKYSKRDVEYISECCKVYHTMGEENADKEVWVDTKKLSIVFESWLEQKRMQFLQSQDNPALEIFRRRSAVIGFRAGMVAWATEERRMTKEALDLALWVAEVTLARQLQLYGEAMNKALEGDSATDMSCVRRGRNMKLFDELPEVFGMEDILRVRQSHGLMGDVSHIPVRWVRNGLAVKTGKRQWKKTAGC